MKFIICTRLFRNVIFSGLFPLWIFSPFGGWGALLGSLIFTSCQNDCEPAPKNQINFRFLQKNTLKADTISITQIQVNEKTDATARPNFSSFLLMDINPTENFTTYTFTGTRKNIPFSHTVVLQYDRNLTKNGSGKCGSIIKIENLNLQNSTFQEIVIRNATLENDKRNQYDVGLICVQ